jgi:hypothetical protein
MTPRRPRRRRRIQLERIAGIQQRKSGVWRVPALLYAFPLLLLTHVAAANAGAQERRNTVCPDPAAPCSSSVVKFKPHQLSFKVLRKTGKETGPLAVSASFYAVMLQSTASNHSNPELKCSSHVPDDARLAAQKLFPERKVFASRYDCGEEADFFNYIDEGRKEFDQEQNFMAVYAGETLAQAQAMLKRVRVTGRFPGANLRKMHVQLGLAFD